MKNFEERKEYFRRLLQEHAKTESISFSDAAIELIADLRARLWGKTKIRRLLFRRGDFF